MAPDNIRARIIELERKTAGAVEPSATAGGVGEPTLPHAEELGELRRQLAKSERTADAARLAMPNTWEHLTVWTIQAESGSCLRCLEGVPQ